MSTFDMTQGLAKGSLGKAMTGGQMVDRLSAGTGIETRIVNGSPISLTFPETGDIGYRLLLQNAGSISLDPGNSGQLQRMTLILQQPYDGNSEVEFETAIYWQDKQPFIDTRAGSVTIIEILSDGSGSFYGRLMYG